MKRSDNHSTVATIGRVAAILAILLAVAGSALLVLCGTDNRIRRAYISRRIVRIGDNISNGADIDVNKALLLKSLQSEYQFERMSAIVAVRYLGAKGCFAAPLIVKSLDDPARLIRREAASAISELGPCAAEAAPQLARNLKVESGDVAAFSARALSAVGPTGLGYFPDLVEASKSSDELLRGEAARAIERMSRTRDEKKDIGCDVSSQ